MNMLQCCNARNGGGWKISFHFKYSWSLQGDHWTVASSQVGLVFLKKFTAPTSNRTNGYQQHAGFFGKMPLRLQKWGFILGIYLWRKVRGIWGGRFFSVNFIITSLAFGCPGGIQKQTQVNNICEITNLVGGWSNPFEKKRQLDSHLPEIFGDADKPSLFLSPKLVIYWPPCSLYLWALIWTR